MNLVCLVKGHVRGRFAYLNYNREVVWRDTCKRCHKIFHSWPED